jgi:hypothetical protein
MDHDAVRVWQQEAAAKSTVDRNIRAGNHAPESMLEYRDLAAQASQRIA